MIGTYVNGFLIKSNIYRDSKNKYKQLIDIECKECKVNFTTNKSSLFRADGKEIQSCGCKRVSNIKKSCTKHGDTSNSNIHPIYRAYMHMKERCYKPNTKHYDRYGGRGVTICDEWKDDYLSFRKWSIDNGWKVGLEIDKDISGSKIYSPDTCKWVTHLENCQHTEHKVGKTGYKNVTQDKRKIPGKSYFGQKMVNGKKIVTKLFESAEDAFDELQKMI